MSLTLHQIKVFMTVADCMSVSKAAQRLHMTQPAVSNIIKQLQDSFDCQLTDVVGRRLFLTSFGETLLKACQDITARVDEAYDDINLLKGSVSGTLKVACVSTAKYFTPSLLGEFKTHHPQVRIQLTVCNRQGLIERLQDNLDDFVIMSHPPNQLPVEFKKFYTDQLIVAGPSDFKVTNKSYHIKDLQHHSWIVRELGSGTRFACDKFFKTIDFEPQYALEISDVEAIKQAIIARMGLSVLSKHSVKLELENNLIQEIPVQGFPINHKWYFVYLQGKTFSPLSSNFFKFAKKTNLTTDV